MHPMFHPEGWRTDMCRDIREYMSFRLRLIIRCFHEGITVNALLLPDPYQFLAFVSRSDHCIALPDQRGFASHTTFQRWNCVVSTSNPKRKEEPIQSDSSVWQHD